MIAKYMFLVSERDNAWRIRLIIVPEVWSLAICSTSAQQPGTGISFGLLHNAIQGLVCTSAGSFHGGYNTHGGGQPRAVTSDLGERGSGKA